MVAASQERGLTLIEVGVFSGMLLLLTLLLSALLAKGQVYTRNTSYYSVAHRESVRALNKIRGELSRATPHFLAINRERIYFLSSKTEPPGPPIEFDPDTGGILWQRWVCFFLDAQSSQILEAEQSLTIPTSTLLTSPHPPVDFNHFQNLENRRTVARGIVSLQMQQLGRQTVQCSVSAEHDGAGRIDAQRSTVHAEATIRLVDGWTP